MSAHHTAAVRILRYRCNHRPLVAQRTLFEALKRPPECDKRVESRRFRSRVVLKTTDADPQSGPEVSGFARAVRAPPGRGGQSQAAERGARCRHRPAAGWTY